jgi:ATP-binding cassette subfamily B protein
VLGIVCVVAPITLFGRRLRGASRSSQDRVAEIGGLVSEVLGATRIVQAFNQEKLESDRFSATVERTFETAKRRIAIRATMTSVVIFLVMGALNLLMWRGAVGVARHEITGGTIAAFVLTGGVVAGPSAPCPRFTAIWCARRAPPAVCPNCCRKSPRLRPRRGPSCCPNRRAARSASRA